MFSSLGATRRVKRAGEIKECINESVGQTASGREKSQRLACCRWFKAIRKGFGGAVAIIVYG